ncbi:MAG: DNA-directed DNA polymerase II small subunit [Euryarchaeota archaeon]|nr:DNA-directed DNA polymerase II small subunit [Euryarchaeota archaeon]
MIVEAKKSSGISNEGVASLFYENGITLSKEAYEYIIEEKLNEKILHEYIEYLKEERIWVAEKSSILDIHLSTKEKDLPTKERDVEFKKRETQEKAEEASTEGRMELTESVRAGHIPAKEVDPDIKILKEIKTDSEGNFDDFLENFRDRYKKLSKIFKERPNTRNFQSINSIEKGGTVKVVGIVRRKLYARTKNTILTIEDLSGSTKVFISKKSSIDTDAIFKDGVVYVEGKSGRGIIFAKNIEFPDLPMDREVNRSKEDLNAVLISDMHVGSKNFLEKEFLRFLRWLNLKMGNKKQRNTASKTKYLVIAGDLIDGIGIYPNQRDDLEILSIYDQYKRLYELLSLVPDYIQIILSPGNHDAARPAIPQPPIPEEFAPDLCGMDNVLSVGNPTLFSMHGVKTLIYHGDTVFDIIEALRVPQNDVVSPMLHMFKKRHLGPIYGKKTGIIPEKEDYLVIDEIPDLFHTGHVHINGHEMYRGTTLINSGTWQEQTEYQIMRNMVPTPCRVPIFNLKTHKTMITNFG